jgi:hypothetical protein
VDPNVQRKTERAAQTETFEAIGREWLAHRAKTTATITQQKATWLREQIFAEMAVGPFARLPPPSCCRRYGRSKLVVTKALKRAKQKCGQVFRYAIATGRAERDISSDLRGSVGAGSLEEPCRPH